jgi:O-antigen/teichoic acid export membrane protein
VRKNQQVSATAFMTLNVLLALPAATRGVTPLAISAMRGATLLCKFALTLFLAHFVGLEGLGTYGLIAGLAAVVPTLASLGLIGGLCRNAVTQNLAEVTEALRKYWLLQAVIYVTAVLAAFASATVVEGWPFVLAVVLILAFEQINDDLFTLLNNLRYPVLANILMFARTAGWMSAFMVLAALYPPLRNIGDLLIFWMAGALATVIGFGYAIRDWPWTSSRSANQKPTSLRHLFNQSRVLYVNNIANIAGQYLDRYLIGAFLGLELTGVYVLFWSIGNALSNLISTSIIQPVWPNLISAHSEGDPVFWQLFKSTLFHTLTGALIVAIAAGAAVEMMVSYLGRPLAVQWSPALWIILLGFVLRMAYEVQGAVFYSRHEDKLTLVSGLFVFAVAAALNVCLLPFLSLYGSALAVAGSYSAGVAVRGLLIRRCCS